MKIFVCLAVVLVSVGFMSPTYQVCNTVQITAHGQEDDGPLGVGEALRIQQKGQDRQRGRQEA